MDYRDSDFDTFPSAPDGSRFNFPMLMCVLSPFIAIGTGLFLAVVSK